MPSLRDQERTTYEDIWAVEAYAAHSPGELFLPLFLDMAQPVPGAVILDAGCGSGEGALALRDKGFRVVLCDLTDARSPEARALPFAEVCLWDNLTRHVGRADYCFAADVLEHIPSQFTMLVVSRLLDVARRGAFFSICLVPDNLGVWVGKPLHQTVQSFTWWRDALAELGTVQECRDLIQTGVYYVVPR